MSVINIIKLYNNSNISSLSHKKAWNSLLRNIPTCPLSTSPFPILPHPSLSYVVTLPLFLPLFFPFFLHLLLGLLFSFPPTPGRILYTLLFFSKIVSTLNWQRFNQAKNIPVVLPKSPIKISEKSVEGFLSYDLTYKNTDYYFTCIDYIPI